jgi:hypothetical protein
MPTRKQVEFAQRVGNGERQVDAYREVYDTEGSPNSQRVSAHRLAHSPNVAPMIEAQRVENARLAARSARSRAHWVIERLATEAEDPDNPGAVRVRALEVIGKASGLYSEEDRATARKSATELELVAELESRLTEILPGIGIPDGIRIPNGIDTDTANTIDTERIESKDNDTERAVSKEKEPPTPL